MEATGAKAAAVLAETTNAAKTFMVMMCVVVVVAVVGATVVDVATMALERRCDRKLKRKIGSLTDDEQTDDVRQIRVPKEAARAGPTILRIFRQILGGTCFSIFDFRLQQQPTIHHQDA